MANVDILNADEAGVTVQARFAKFLLDYESQDLRTTTNPDAATGASQRSAGFKVRRQGSLGAGGLRVRGAGRAPPSG